MNLRRFHSKAVSAASFGVALVAMFLTLAPVSAQAEVKIGALMPMTGDLQAYGPASLNGIKLAVEEINAAGGVLGQNVSVSVGDTQTQPQASIDAAEKLVSVEGVAGIIGAMSSGDTIPVGKSVAARLRVPMISNASTSPTLTGLDDNDFLFRTVPSDAFQGVALAEVTRKHEYRKLAVIYVNNDYGEGLARSFADAFAKADGEVTGSLPYEMGKASYRGELSQLSKGADGLVLIGYPENGVTILRQGLEGGYFDDFVFTDGMKAPEVIDAIGQKYLNGSVGTVPQARTDTGTYKRFESAYRQRFGELPPKPFIDTAYDATMVLALAIEKAGKTTGTAVRNALRDVANPPGETLGPGDFAEAKRLIANGVEVDYVGASGSINFDDAGDVSGTFAEWAILDGEIKTVRIFEPKM
ncbi:MAG: ABC transporter substrate-binding protein [Gammaproteobacteria bacterium]|nr:ABC transporter substrate-binding protein [Gammaproteobacteria bacterium]NIR84487.1 ABC transporter substrate-binding protein [Gammaproteobacteria bacterium]NIR90390.1 ABC transporter substrate-binding protein [Gammaproteobacteria bacterium]NIU05538.1 ABC transporter substrate-binding protein [Gammaproteobacteria bacterium]NIV52677.1 ABC transporter substrate-binding protein [Gammaproteobacteria bacterium]